MQEIVDAILKVEERSARMIEETRRRLVEEKETADAEMAESIKRAREQAADLIRSRVDSARSETNRERDQAVRQAREEQHAVAATRSASLASIVERIVKLIVTPSVGPHS